MQNDSNNPSSIPNSADAYTMCDVQIWLMDAPYYAPSTAWNYIAQINRVAKVFDVDGPFDVPADITLFADDASLVSHQLSSFKNRGAWQRWTRCMTAVLRRFDADAGLGNPSIAMEGDD
ncbi:hypothetical protein [Paracoccus sp. N5]|uniref:hypothetical protein n=1 Tax=Paracoccus sp. N5 TaxID=1101189 RepID=UPI00056BFF3B|nr:hypothetical protein [Paracoccus sp. N5]